MNLCEYKDIFGKPREGVHSHRIPYIDIASVDFFGTIIIAIIIAILGGYSIIKTTIYSFILGIILHKLFCVDTKLNKLIFEPF